MRSSVSVVIGDAVDYGGRFSSNSLSDLVLRELPVTMIVPLRAIALMSCTAGESAGIQPDLSDGTLGQMLSMMGNAMNVSIRRFIELIILY